MTMRQRILDILARRAKRRAIRSVHSLPPDQQSLAAVYAMGIRDGLQIAADIRQKIRCAKGEE